jgi:membrane-associated phospholipid phosphatase
LSGIDRSVFEWFVEHRESWLTTVMQVVTTLGGSALLIPLVIGVGVWCRWRGRSWRPLAILGAVYLGAWAASNAVKALTDRARPPADLAIGHYDSPAFPSGHATHAAAVWIAVAVVMASTTAGRRYRSAIGAGVGSIIVLVGLSRLYLGAHWLTDVLAGWALGALWALLVTGWWHRESVTGGNRRTER